MPTRADLTQLAAAVCPFVVSGRGIPDRMTISFDPRQLDGNLVTALESLLGPLTFLEKQGGPHQRALSKGYLKIEKAGSNCRFKIGLAGMIFQQKRKRQTVWDTAWTPI